MQELAEKDGKRATAWIRDAIYETLKRVYPASIYNEAAAKDDAEWRQSVRRRVEGRQKPQESEQVIDASNSPM